MKRSPSPLRALTLILVFSQRHPKQTKIGICWERVGLILFGILLTTIVTGCVTQRTVRDSKGNIIYQEADLTSPFEDTEERLDEVRERERELGW